MWLAPEYQTQVAPAPSDPPDNESITVSPGHIVFVGAVIFVGATEVGQGRHWVPVPSQEPDLHVVAAGVEQEPFKHMP